MLLVIERADANGGNGAALHLRRMFWLFVIGCLHLYLLWWGDILAHYALVGVIALFFCRQGTRTLVLLAIALLLLSMILNGTTAAALFAAAARTTPTDVALWNAFASAFGNPPHAESLAQVEAIRGSFAHAAAWRWDHAISPLAFLPIGGAETLGAMLLGMAALRSGFVTAAWSRRAYRRVAWLCVGASLLGYAVIGWQTMATGFDQRWVYLGSLVLSEPFRTMGYVGYAALVMLLLRPEGRLTAWLTAAGRMLSLIHI